MKLIFVIYRVKKIKSYLIFQAPRGGRVGLIDLLQRLASSGSEIVGKARIGKKNAKNAWKLRRDKAIFAFP